jgi:starch phosphorylase
MNDHGIAYFSMEIAMDPAMPTYSGGLGILAGDTIGSAANLRVPMVAVTLLHRKGYFRQKLDASGWQTEEPVTWPVEDFLEELPQRVSVTIEQRPVQLRAWQYTMKGCTGFDLPVILLDADLPENSAEDRTLTHFLYGGDARYRLCQEIILGIGGVKMLRALGCQDIKRFHMNEGHASLLTLELMDEQARNAGRKTFTAEDAEAVRALCVFTTHTPVPAGHDKFPLDLVNRVLGRPEIAAMPDLFCCDGLLNMTYLALNLSRYINGVAKKHAEVSRSMFAAYEIDAITNGVRVSTWCAASFQNLFERYIPGWREDNFSLRNAISLPLDEVWNAHLTAKRKLLEHVNWVACANLSEDALTLGFARRAAAYKRADLLIRDVCRLKSIAAKAGRLQIIYAGKAHPYDESGKKLIQQIFQAREGLQPEVRLIYLENYDMNLAKLLTAGVDVWLNTPQPPLEASGTSGMKAALNGVPSLGILDGWWIEGCIEGVTGWAIGELLTTPDPNVDRTPQDADSLYRKSEEAVMPTFYQDRERFLKMMRQSIALNGSFFNTQRMLHQYVLKAYFR